MKFLHEIPDSRTFYCTNKVWKLLFPTICGLFKAKIFWLRCVPSYCDAPYYKPLKRPLTIYFYFAPALQVPFMPMNSYA